ncbi:MAG: hypothetical protein P0Y65_20890 [Candidatus Devosia phytovorans]|uniref:Uncharacterized protein n=1 Tax=Candidatus Devosia phytovorans TaxID=3121372 RepID=A0AAJ5VUW6_9HYPH|nr:hypothetical protein [Devosia sp.]WEK04600.1 MAG: hypothetical protein P0Y65_20890 [Devosia sp.]
MTASPSSETVGFEKSRLGQWGIDQAVAGLARAVLAERGEVAVHGGPTVGHLVAMVAGEYQEPSFAERGLEAVSRRPNVRLYRQIELSERERQDEEFLDRIGLAATRRQSTGTAAFDLLEMEDPVALVCIGGDKQSMALAKAFSNRFPERLLFALASTGGAAAYLLSEASASALDAESTILAEVRERDRSRWESESALGDKRRRIIEEESVPYPIIMQVIVDKIVHSDSGDLY